MEPYRTLPVVGWNNVNSNNDHTGENKKSNEKTNLMTLDLLIYIHLFTQCDSSIIFNALSYSKFAWGQTLNAQGKWTKKIKQIRNCDKKRQRTVCVSLSCNLSPWTLSAIATEFLILTTYHISFCVAFFHYHEFGFFFCCLCLVCALIKPLPYSDKFDVTQIVGKKLIKKCCDTGVDSVFFCCSAIPNSIESI